MPHVTFIHGISNKPEEKKLLKIWNDTLANDSFANSLDLGASGVSSSMIYWADVFYEKPSIEDSFESAAGLESIEEVAVKEEEPDMSWRENIRGEEKEMVDALAAKLSFDLLVNDSSAPPKEEMGRTLERIPLPWFVKRRLMKWLLRDVHHYLFNSNYSPRVGTSFIVQDEIRSRVMKKLNEVNTDKHIVISHSMGTIIMYDCLKRIQDCPSIHGLMTIGSPLGIDEVQDKLKPEWTRNNGFPEKLKGQWVNVYDSLDPVTGFDGNIANDYKQNSNEVIEVINEQSWGAWRHNITNYLSGPKLRSALSKMLAL